MKKCLFFLFLVVVNVNAVYSQIIAGNAALGLVISNPAINFSVTTIYGTSSGVVDLNCDSIADIRLELFKGPTAIDGTNYAFLHILNPAFQVCADTANPSIRMVKLFNQSDTVIPSVTTAWYNDSIMQLGNYGCMECYGPFSVSAIYFGYKNVTTSQVGWVKASFNLIDGGVGAIPITLSAPEVLSPCSTTSISSTSPSTPTYTGSGAASCGPFTYNYTIYSPSCPGNCDGSILITNITGGTPAYSCFWSMGVVAPSISNICAGSYLFNITDAVGNTCTANFLIQDPVPMTFSLSSSNVTCYGGVNGTVCCTNLVGGNPPYSFSWSPFGGTLQCSNNLGAALYNFEVIDSNGCIGTASVVVHEPSPILVTETITQASCSSCCDGNSQLQISGGITPYTTVYTNPPFCPGIYGYSVTDANGCIFADSVLISYATSLTEQSFETKFDVFPNPGNGNFEIKNLNSNISNAKIKVVDIYGKCVLNRTTEFQTQSIQLDLKVADGVYFLHIELESSNKEFIKKIVVFQ